MEDNKIISHKTLCKKRYIYPIKIFEQSKNKKHATTNFLETNDQQVCIRTI